MGRRGIIDGFGTRENGMELGFSLHGDLFLRYVPCLKHPRRDERLHPLELIHRLIANLGVDFEYLIAEYLEFGEIGYINGNIWWVHKTVNIMKWSLSMKEFITWCDLMSQNAPREGFKKNPARALDTASPTGYNGPVPSHPETHKCD